MDGWTGRRFHEFGIDVEINNDNSPHRGAPLFVHRRIDFDSISPNLISFKNRGRSPLPPGNSFPIRWSTLVARARSFNPAKLFPRRARPTWCLNDLSFLFLSFLPRRSLLYSHEYVIEEPRKYGMYSPPLARGYTHARTPRIISKIIFHFIRLRINSHSAAIARLEFLVFYARGKNENVTLDIRSHYAFFANKLSRYHRLIVNAVFRTVSVVEG